MNGLHYASFKVLLRSVELLLHLGINNGLVAQWLELPVQFQVVRGSIPCEVIYSLVCYRACDALLAFTASFWSLDQDELLTKIQQVPLAPPFQMAKNC